MCTSPVTVANYFLERAWASNKPISQMKLQKLVFFAHAFHLGIFGKPLVDEVVQAWKFGPVFESIYKSFKVFGSDPITKESFNNYARIPFFHLKNNRQLSENEKVISDEVWRVFEDVSATDLMRITHQNGSPWHQAVKPHLKHGIGFPRGITIPDDTIASFYKATLDERES